MWYHLFSCLAPRSLQDALITSNLPPRPPPDVPRRFKRCLSYPPNLPRTSPGAPEKVSRQPQDPSQTSTSAFQELPRGHELLIKYAHSLDLLPTCTHGPRLEGQRQISQVRGPEFMAGSAGPRRVCNYVLHWHMFVICLTYV